MKCFRGKPMPFASISHRAQGRRAKNREVLGLVLSTLVALSSITLAAAQSIVVTDPQGITRAFRDFEPNTTGNVEVEVEVADGTEATLTNEASAQLSRAVVRDGVATFENVRPGIYSLGFDNDTAVVGTVTIGGEISLAAAGAVGGAAAGGVLLGETLVDQLDESGKDEDMSRPPGEDTPEPPAEPTIRPRPERPRATPTPDDCPICDPDATPPPIPAPFPEDELPESRSGRTVSERARALSPYR